MAERRAKRPAVADHLLLDEEKRPAFDFGNLLGLAFAGLVVTALVILVTYGLFSRNAPAAPAPLFRKAPDFTIELFDGGTFTLSDTQGEPVIVNMWTSSCLPCHQEMPALEYVWRLYRERGVVFVGLAIQEDGESAQASLNAFEMTYPNGLDRDGAIYEAYEATGVPETFFIDRDGIVVRRVIGAVTEVQLVSFVEDLLR